MNQSDFNELYLRVKEEYKLPNEIRETFLNEYIELISEWEVSINFEEIINKKTVEISELYSLFWGVLALSLDYSDFSSKHHEIRACLHTLSITLANNVLALIKLACDGLDYQSGILLRNTYEVCFTFLTILVDNNKCKIYFDSAKKDNSYRVWKKNFTLKHLNESLETFENTLSKKNDDFKFVRNWRKKQYHYYSTFVHNDFCQCFVNSYGMPETKNDNMIMNIWGLQVTRINHVLDPLNDLMFWTSRYLYKFIISNNITTKKQLVEKEFDFWNESAYIHFMAETLFMDYKEHKEVRNSKKKTPE